MQVQAAGSVRRAPGELKQRRLAGLRQIWQSAHHDEWPSCGGDPADMLAVTLQGDSKQCSHCGNLKLKEAAHIWHSEVR